LHCESATHRSLTRGYADIDFVGRSKQSRAIRTLFKNLGYEPREAFNRLHGDTRLIFNDLEHQRRIDIFLDTFEMCHIIDLKDRLQIDPLTIPLADLLLTKLQVVEINERDVRDTFCLFMDHNLGETDANETINGRYIAKLLANDWGFHRTVRLNLEKLKQFLNGYQLDATEKSTILSKIDGLMTRIDADPKSMRWKMRAKVGDKVKWYDEPDQDKKVVDSRFAEERLRTESR
jgi:hypothetical protein